jgi:hypothetical protein
MAIEGDSDLFYEKYKPVFNHIGTEYQEGETFDSEKHDEYGYPMYFETYGEEIEYVRQQDPAYIWTLCDDGEVSYIAQGFRWVNRICYLIASVPYKEGDRHSYRDLIWEEPEDYDQE